MRSSRGTGVHPPYDELPQGAAERQIMPAALCTVNAAGASSASRVLNNRLSNRALGRERPIVRAYRRPEQLFYSDSASFPTPAFRRIAPSSPHQAGLERLCYCCVVRHRISKSAPQPWRVERDCSTGFLPRSSQRSARKEIGQILRKNEDLAVMGATGRLRQSASRRRSGRRRRARRPGTRPTACAQPPYPGWP